MARILRGDIIWADLNPTIGHEQSGLRPILVVSHEVFNKKSGTVIAVAITSQFQKAGFPLRHLEKIKLTTIVRNKECQRPIFQDLAFVQSFFPIAA